MQNRREMMLRSAAVAAALAAAGVLPARAQVVWDKAVLDAKSVDVCQGARHRQPVESKDVVLTAPTSPCRAVVPVAASTANPNVKQIIFLIEKNPTTLAGSFEFTDAVETSIGTRVNMGADLERLRGRAARRRPHALRQEGSEGDARRLRRLSANRRAATAAPQRVTQPAPSSRRGVPNEEEQNMSDPMRIRAIAQGSGAVVRVLMSHEMETGQRKDADGKTIPAWFIPRQRGAQRQDRAHRALGPRHREKPVSALTFKGAKPGDKISVSWVDNRGDKRTDEATVA